MTITTTIIDRIPIGNKIMIIGKSVLAGTVTTGDVDVPLKVVTSFVGHEKAGAQKGFSTNEVFPLANTAVTAHIETTDGTFYWRAVGSRQ